MPEDEEVLAFFKQCRIYLIEIPHVIGNDHEEDRYDSQKTGYAQYAVDCLPPGLSHYPSHEDHAETDRKEPCKVSDIPDADSRTREIEPRDKE